MKSRINGSTQRRRWIPGEIVIVSANQSSWWEWNGYLDDIQLLLDPSAFDAAAAELSDRPVQLLDGMGIIDPIISELFFQISAELTCARPTAPLFEESITTALIAHLLRYHSTLRTRLALQRIDIAIHRLRIALEYIDAHLGDDLRLSDIAAETNMSLFHFARGFRKAMGRSPHRYIMARRIDRSKVLLRESSDEISMIARNVGFSTSSHFSALFRAECGITPRQYRQLIGTATNHRRALNAQTTRSRKTV